MFNDIKENGFFTNSDGCGCGYFTYKLNDQLWISVYRSCRKSSMTPDEKLWQLHDVDFYEDVSFSYYSYEGEKHIDDVEGFGEYITNAKLNKKDEVKLYEILSKIAKDDLGNEFRNED